MKLFQIIAVVRSVIYPNDENAWLFVILNEEVPDLGHPSWLDIATKLLTIARKVNPNRCGPHSRIPGPLGIPLKLIGSLHQRRNCGEFVQSYCRKRNTEWFVTGSVNSSSGRHGFQARTIENWSPIEGWLKSCHGANWTPVRYFGQRCGIGLTRHGIGPTRRDRDNEWTLLFPFPIRKRDGNSSMFRFHHSSDGATQMYIGKMLSKTFQ
jgi:hypothetical protein